MKDTKEQILKVALRLFLQKNFKEVTMKDIVANTGLSKGAFYHYFPSKEQMFLEVIEYNFHALFGNDYSNYDQNNLFNFFHDHLKFIETQMNKLDEEFGVDATPQSTNFYLMIFDAVNLFPDFREKMMNINKTELLTWAEVVANARKNGEISSTLSDKQIAQIFISTGDGIALNLILNASLSIIKNDLIVLWEAFYNTIRK